MKAYRITIEAVVEAKSAKKAAKLETRMLDAVADETLRAACEPIEEVDADE